MSKEHYASGSAKATTRGAVDSDGIFRLEGKQYWYFESGQSAYSVDYRRGQKVGMETYWSAPGVKQWAWVHEENGKSVWTQYWPNGKTRHISHWTGSVADGQAQEFDREGRLLSSVMLKDGDITR